MKESSNCSAKPFRFQRLLEFVEGGVLVGQVDDEFRDILVVQAEMVL